MRDTKYVIFSDGKDEFAVIFPRALTHKDVARGLGVAAAVGWSKLAGSLVPVSAGFVDDEKAGSESLNLSPRPEDRALLASLVKGLTP